MQRTIQVVGLGAGDIEQLPLGIYRLLTNKEEQVFIRTENHPVVASLQKEGMTFTSFDSYYETSETFADVYENIVATLVEEAREKSIIYAVPGHPMLAEKTVQLLLEQSDVRVEIIGGQSYLDDLFTALQIDPIEGFQFVDAHTLSREMLQYDAHLVICQVSDSFILSDVKLTLLEDLSPDYVVTVAEAVGTKMEKLLQVPLEQLDRVIEASNLTSLYVPPVEKNSLMHQFSTLRSIIRNLRGPDGCPWDKKQTHESLRQYAIEEVYELIDAIHEEDDEAIIEELGDVLLQVMLHSQIGEDDGYFTIDDVIKSTSEKMIHRHPHVFNRSENVEKTWDELKKEERKETQEQAFLLDSVVRHAPAMQVAYELQKKAAKVGFDWDDVADVWAKMTEEINEFKEAVQSKDVKEMEKEFGDILFVLVNISRFYKIHPELALKRTNDKFITRFHEVEKEVQRQGKNWEEMSLEELDKYWERAKRKE